MNVLTVRVLQYTVEDARPEYQPISLRSRTYRPIKSVQLTADVLYALQYVVKNDRAGTSIRAVTSRWAFRAKFPLTACVYL